MQSRLQTLLKRALKADLKRPFSAGQAKKEGGNRIFKVVLTGGPCAGKSTAVDLLHEKLEPSFKVYVVPEMATMTIMGGFSMHVRENPEVHLKIFNQFLQTQTALEDHFVNLARLDQKDLQKDAIVLMDRALLDNFAYAPTEVKRMWMKQYGKNMDQIRDSRYDMVLHMLTTAVGAEEYYTTSNNKARTEGIEVARQLDYNIRQAWNGHHHHL